MFSYWEQQSFSHYDHVVVGAGIVGLSVAIELRVLYPKDSILVLERSLLPTGASSRNAGFACIGSATELLDDLEHATEDEVISLCAWRKAGLERLRKRLGDAHIGYRANGSYELISEKEMEALGRLDYLNELLRPVTGQPAFRLANDKIKPSGFSHAYVRALIENTCEGELHSGKMLRALNDFARQQGIEVKTGAEVLRFDEEPDKVMLTVKDPFRPEVWRFSCHTLSVCTNAFAKQLLPDVAVLPGRGQVLITGPVRNLAFKGVYHLDKGYYYFREIDGRVMLGGGRNLDFEGETTTEFALTELIQQDLERKLRDIILPETDFEIAQRWAGIMAFGATKQPIVKAFSNRVFGAFKLSGMGVALASEVAVQLKNLIADK